MVSDIRFDGRFRLCEILGSGSFGEVYLGIDDVTEKKVAVKLEKTSTNSPQLLYESKVYSILSDGGTQSNFV